MMGEDGERQMHISLAQNATGCYPDITMAVKICRNWSI